MVVLALQFWQITQHIGHKHTKPPKNCNHKYNVFVIITFDNVWTSHLGFFLI